MKRVAAALIVRGRKVLSPCAQRPEPGDGQPNHHHRCRPGHPVEEARIMAGNATEREESPSAMTGSLAGLSSGALAQTSVRGFRIEPPKTETAPIARSRPSFRFMQRCLSRRLCHGSPQAGRRFRLTIPRLCCRQPGRLLTGRTDLDLPDSPQHT
jgi:hypothetical protein